MNEQKPIISELSRLTDDVYLTEDSRAIARIPKVALGQRFKGLALGAPHRVRIDSQQRLPVLLVTGESAARSAQFPLNSNTVAVATDLERGIVLVGEAFPGDHTKAPEDEPEPPKAKPIEPPLSRERAARRAALGAGDTAGTAWLNFRDLLELPWRPSQLALRVIAFDEVSNPVLVTLESQHTMAIEYFPADVAAEIVQRNKAAAESGRAFPRFVRSRETPLLRSSGVALALEKDTARAGAKSLPVHGALRLELSFQSIVRRRRDSSAPEVSGRSDPPAAVVKATVLVTIKNHNRPIRLDVNIPVWSDHKLQAGEEVDAAFSLDLATALPSELLPGEYCIYLVAGPYLSGPHKLVIQPSRWR
jgi:hypothetical protein